MNIDAINSFIGSDWVYKENDCWSVFRDASNAVFGVEIHELEIPETSNPGANSHLFESNSHNPEWEFTESPKPGCAVLFKNIRGHPVHIGLYITDGNVLHCEGGPKRPGRTSYDSLNELKKVYQRIEFYEYLPNNRSQ